MRKGKIKRHRRRAKIRAAAWRLASGVYDLAVDAWWLYIGMAPFTVPLTMLLIGGALYKLLGPWIG